MKKVLNVVVLGATIVSVALTNNVFASTNMSETEQFNHSNRYKNHQRTSLLRHSTTYLKADKNLRSARFMEKLNLDASQQKLMQTIKLKYQSQIQNLRDDIRSEREALAEMMKSSDSNSNLRSQHQKIIGLDQKMHNLRFEVMLEMRDILTTEQRQQWVESMEELKANRQGRFR